ncbi:MAG: hypothetical protein AABY95_07370 [Pseudomonadota bacterium]
MKIARGLVGLCLLLPAWAWAAKPAGEITLATGVATSTSRDGSVRNVSKGGRVYSGEFINTGPNSYLNIKFRDGGLMLLRPNTRFQIELFEYETKPKVAEQAASAAPAEAPKTEPAKSPAEQKPETTPVAEPPAEPAAAPADAPADAPAQSEVSPALAPPGSGPSITPPVPSVIKAEPARQKALFRLIKGGLRTVTGLIGKKDFADYQLRMPTATIGIRGTEFQTWTCDLACAQDPVVSAALKAVFGPNFDPGKTEIVGTIKGLIEVTNTATGETTSVKPGQFFLSTPTGDIPLPKEPEFIAKDRMPDPKACL